MPTLARDGVELAYSVQGEGPPLVLVHGFTGGAVDWAAVAPRLARSRRVVTFDHRGHGASTNTGDPASYRLDLLTDDVLELVDHLELEQLDLLGHSMGGRVAMDLVIRRPDRVRSLVLMDTAAGSVAGAASFFGPAFDVASTSGMAGVVELFRPFVPDEQVMASLEHKLVAMDPVAFVTLGRALGEQESVLDRLATVAVPTTVIVGELDEPFRAPSADLAATIPGAELVVIPGAGHSPQEAAPDAWVAAVETHLRRVG